MIWCSTRPSPEYGFMVTGVGDADHLPRGYAGLRSGFGTRSRSSPAAEIVESGRLLNEIVMLWCATFAAATWNSLDALFVGLVDPLQGGSAQVNAGWRWPRPPCSGRVRGYPGVVAVRVRSHCCVATVS